jgi:hypothetical protein
VVGAFHSRRLQIESGTASVACVGADCSEQTAPASFRRWTGQLSSPFCARYACHERGPKSRLTGEPAVEAGVPVPLVATATYVRALPCTKYGIYRIGHQPTRRTDTNSPVFRGSMNVLQARRKAGSTAPEKRTGNATDGFLAPAVGVMLATRRLA